MEETGDMGLEILYNNAFLEGKISQEDVKEIYLRIMELAAGRTELYAMGDSSIRVEMFSELVKSICFTLKMGINAQNEPPKSALKGDLRMLLEVGRAKIESGVQYGRELLRRAEEGMLNIENISYQGVIPGIEKFFKGYDYYYFAHEIPGDIDYQLFVPVSEQLQGIDYITEYLRHLTSENEFCGHFETNTITDLLKSFCADYKGLLINLFEPVVVNAIGLKLLGADIFKLEITKMECELLKKRFEEWGDGAIIELERASDELCHQLGISKEGASYAKAAVPDLYPRIRVALAAGTLENIFIRFKEARAITSVRFYEGEVMDDEKLRELIDEICDCGSVSEKIALMKSDIHSMPDFAEVLNICFWGDECEALFDALNKTEHSLMLAYIQSRPPEWRSESGWEHEFMKYIEKSNK